MTHSSGIDAESFWRDTLTLPGEVSLMQSFARELSDYTGEGIETVLDKMRTAKERFAQRWNDKHPDYDDKASIIAFYNQDLLEAYELSFWHVGGMGKIPLNYAAAALWLKKRGARNVLDFGSGIGSGAIALGKAGLHVDVADISRPMLAYVKWRLDRRNIPHRTIDLNDSHLPKNRYDAICCFDVLEHVPDPEEVFSQLSSALKRGGYLFCVFISGDDEERPMHISSFPSVLNYVLRTDLYFDWSAGSDVQKLGAGFSVIRKRLLGKLRNRIRKVYFLATGQLSGEK